MVVTFAKLAQYMKKEQTNADIKGRSTWYSIPDAMAKGLSIMMDSKEMQDLMEEEDEDEVIIEDVRDLEAL